MDKPKPDCRTFEEHHIRVNQELPPEGWVIVDAYHPCSSVTPWDSYGNSHLAEIARVLKAAGIESMPLVTNQTNLIPSGTGPGGRVRFGDDMMPGIYETAVRTEDENRANVAIIAHQAVIQEWLKDPSKPMPEVLRQ